MSRIGFTRPWTEEATYAAHERYAAGDHPDDIAGERGATRRSLVMAFHRYGLPVRGRGRPMGPLARIETPDRPEPAAEAGGHRCATFDGVCLGCGAQLQHESAR